ncbi:MULTISPECIES: hypothetical protein [unclassified Sphingomonas]|uniref:hypothetical protein n=1 Tax=unclassified Sphingomonas TaxID=196159 RepID=UPI002269E1F2|nr:MULTISPECIES: hypothetical protein [unclassified Sphingomonas]
MTYRYAVLAGCAALSACSPSTDMPLASKASAEFHSRLNAGQYAAIYGATAPAFKAATPESKFTPILEAVHRKLGLFKDAKVIGWNDTVNTNGHSLSIRCAANYSKGPAEEAFVFSFDKDKAAVVAYNINSTALILP